MPDISMCTQTQCPNAGHCYRVQATPSEYQSMSAFDYVVDKSGVRCEHYMPMRKDPAKVWYCDSIGRGD